MGYNISLRKSEANHVVIDTFKNKYGDKTKGKITIALVGNPNCGKTTLFNLLTGSKQHVGNWPGVTVEKKEGNFCYKGTRFEIIDLPGIYSLSPNSIEEVVTRNYIIKEKPDIVINIIDGTNLERSMYLTTQLIDTHVPMLIAINMFDEVKQKGIEIDLEKMSELLKMSVIPISAKKDAGTDELLETVLEQITQNNDDRIHISYGSDLENAVCDVEKSLTEYTELANQLYSRWFAIQLLCEDAEIEKLINTNPRFSVVMSLVGQKIKNLKSIYPHEVEMVVSEQRFGFIIGVMRECVRVKKTEISKIDVTESIDNIILNKYLSFPIFALILWVTFQLTFALGGFFGGIIKYGVNLISDVIGKYMPAGVLKDLIIDGVISGVGGILVFLPQILILFLIIAILEDSGYMARVAFIMDRLMHFLGVHGKSFISLFMGIGCNVPGIMAARTLENEEDRKVTVLINPFMSCSARLPVYVLITGMFFSGTAGTVIFSLYMLGIFVAILTAKLLKIFFFRKKSVPFVMELPPYRTPSVKSLLVHMWERASMFLKKMGGVILVGSIIIWSLSYFPKTTQFSDTVKQMEIKAQATTNLQEKDRLVKEIDHYKAMEQLENSYIGKIGKTIQPFFRPLGFDWRESVAIITGVVGKEVVVSTLSVLYGSDSSDNAALKTKMEASGTNAPIAYGFLVFILLYVPCLAAIAAVMKETNSLKWTAFSIVYGVGIAYLVSYVSRITGSLIFQ